MTHTSTEQPEALRLADIVERLNVGVHSQAIAEEYSAAARELRRLHERDTQADAQIKELLQVIKDLERCSEMLSQRVQELGEMARENRSKRIVELEQRIAELEEQMDAIGAGGVEPLRKRAEAAPQAAQWVEKDAARYRFLRDGDWRENDAVAPFIHLQLNALWDEKIDAAIAAQTKQGEHQ